MATGKLSNDSRTCVRALLHTDNDELLLIDLVDPLTANSFWITPGGGIEHGAPTTPIDLDNN